MNWNDLAQRTVDVYGGYVDWDERFFECPHCGEPIYACDWDEWNERCPVCEEVIEGEDDE